MRIVTISSLEIVEHIVAFLSHVPPTSQVPSAAWWQLSISIRVCEQLFHYIKKYM